MKRVAIIQARAGSTRLPGKVLMPLGGTTVLGCVVNRLANATALDEIVVATSTEPADDAVLAEAQRLGVTVTRGSTHDVLSRFAGSAHDVGADIVVRITSDCPLIDGFLIDDMLSEFANGPACDYLSNTLERTFPRGLDAEIFTREALLRAHREARETYQREHVTPYLYQHPEIFELRGYSDPGGANRANYRWTLDTSEDYEFLRSVYEAHPDTAARDLRTEDVFALLKRRPQLMAINAHVRQKGIEE